MSLVIGGYNQVSTDRQKARATEFVNRNDRQITRMAERAYLIKNGESDRKTGRNIRAALFSLPVVAVASDLILKKGVKSSLKHGASWGIALAAPAAVAGIAKALSKPDENGNRHNNMSLGTHFVLSIAGYFGGVAALQKISANKSVNRVADTIIDGAKNTFNKVKSEIKIPENIKAKASEFMTKTKISNLAEKTMNMVKNSSFTPKAMKLGKNIVRNSTGLMVAGIIGASIGSAIKQSLGISSIKSNIKNAQLDTARNLINTYAAENEALKS